MWSLPVTLLIQWGVTQGEPLLMLLYRITLVPMSEDLRKVDPGLLSPFYADDVAFDGSARRSDQLLNLILERGADWEYFPKTAK